MVNAAQTLAKRDQKVRGDGGVTIQTGDSKCNLFVYDVITQSSQKAPFNQTIPYVTSKWPPVANEWARFDNSSDDRSEGWSNINYRHKIYPVKPGSILALQRQGVSGHVSIIDKPDDGKFTAKVTPGSKIQVDLLMQGRSLSAASTEVKSSNDWGFRGSENLSQSSFGIEIPD